MTVKEAGHAFKLKHNGKDKISDPRNGKWRAHQLVEENGKVKATKKGQEPTVSGAGHLQDLRSLFHWERVQLTCQEKLRIEKTSFSCFAKLVHELCSPDV